ncbi:MAG: succinyl-diaminopimelate desuccinylase [Armatimonadetes bacterium]|nr:succinyl-diaminopimelate desuccinylase [Armatimonadota bacterium]
MPTVVEIATELIRRPSVTPDDAGCTDYLAALFGEAGFTVRHLDFNDVKNLWVTHGTAEPLIVFDGHCDVVPPGPREAWNTDPFTPTTVDGMLYGRGASDMKGPLAAMVAALLDHVKANPNHPGTLGMLVTSDEEGYAVDGTGRALKTLVEEGVKIDFAIVGEPTSEDSFGDMIKVGRRGSVSAKMVVRGKQGHVAYPHLALNPIHTLSPFLTELLAFKWDMGNENFPPTTLQVTNIHAGTGAVNVIPGSVELDFNLRYNTLLTAPIIQDRITKMAHAFGLDCTFEWNASAMPFVTRDRRLIGAIATAIIKETKQTPREGTGGGTSDARFFAAHKIPVVEFGPSNATIHAANECVAIGDLEACVRVYKDALANLLSGE